MQLEYKKNICRCFPIIYIYLKYDIFIYICFVYIYIGSTHIKWYKNCRDIF